MATKTSKVTKKIVLKPIIRMRVRCKEEHSNPWLRRLYVLWAAPLKPPEADSPPASPKFALAQSDAKGYLSPKSTVLDPKPDNTMGMFPDHKYLFYFVRWPSSKLAESIQGDLQDFEAAKKKWGDPKEIAPVFKDAGKAKSGATIQEGIIEVEEDPESFIPGGSDFYKGWTLFRDMPGTGSNNTADDIQCPPLKEQVRRLQYHLGALRYPIGNQWHPYSPEPFTPTSAREKGKTDLLYPNEGVFDIVTWNCVLAFQRHARKGLAKELVKSPTPTLDAGTFDPLEIAQDWRNEINDSDAYLTDTPADASAAFADIPTDCDTVVEEKTGAAMKNWLTGNLRKPDKILVAYKQYDSWMHEDALSSVQAFDKDLQRLGVKNSVQFNNAFRDTRMSVLKAGKGQKINSIHKSGFAFDFAMDNFVGPRKDYPLYFVRDAEEKKSVRWMVYTPVEAKDVPPQFQGGSTTPPGKEEAYVEYVKSISPWRYEPADPEGGEVGQPLQIDASVFLNLTKVCEHAGLMRIGPRSDWTGSGQTSRYELTDAGSFEDFVGNLAGALSFAVSAKHPHRQTELPAAVIDGGTLYELTALSDLSDYLSLWVSAAKRLDPTPDVQVTPGTKEGDRLLRSLRGKKFKGKKVQITVSGLWKGGEGSSNVTPGMISTGELELGPKTEFPLKLDFVLRPVTEPVTLEPGSVIEIPQFGTAQSMEWWHFQYTKGFTGQDWKTILGWIGWTEEGLLGRLGGKPIWGLYGLGYIQRKHLDVRAQ